MKSKMKLKMKSKIVTVNALKRKCLENENKMHFTCSSAGRQVLGMFKPRPTERVLMVMRLSRCQWLLSEMPTPTIRTVMLQELAEHHNRSQQQRLRQRIASALSDVSSSGTSDSMSEVSDLASLMSIDTPDVDVSSDASMHSNDPPASGSDTDSLYSVSDFEVEYYTNWKRRYRELLRIIKTTRVLHPAPPIPKNSQLRLLDHWRLHSPERFRRKLRVEPQTFDGLLSLIEEHPIFYNNSNNDQLAVHIQLSVFLFRAGHYGNASSPEDTAQWAGISVGGVEKCTDRVIVALLSFHDEAIHLPDAIEKESSKSYVDEAVCPEWRGGFLLADGSKFPLYQRPGLHGDAWFDKDGAYSMDCQVRSFSVSIIWHS